ncbi:MAG: Fic family protein [Candidatus Tectomicrobia bacterium]|nr:Fic family protein [Candidatus Tectomicrobia bacterium]
MNPEYRKRIDTLKAELDELRPLKPEHVAALKDYFKIGLTYTSNALEGNSLTETETKIVIEDGLAIGGKPLKDHLEAVGHAEAYDFMLSLAGQHRIVERHILQLHHLFYRRIDEEQAGRYRTVRVFITGSKHVPPSPAQVPVRMQAFCKEIPAKRKQMHPVDFAAWLHFHLVSIHPFVDGNGRTARLVMNSSLIQDSYPVVIIPPILRREYIDTLEVCHRIKEEPEPFFDFIARAAIESLRDYIRLLRSE